MLVHRICHTPASCTSSKVSYSSSVTGTEHTLIYKRRFLGQHRRTKSTTPQTRMKKLKRNAAAPAVAERYFYEPEAPFLDTDGKSRERAPKHFTTILRSLNGSYRPKFDLSACLGKNAKFGGNIWFWSDQLFSHANIIRFCNRPFNSVEEMNRSMLRNCAARVQNDDIVIFGGDVHMKDLNSANAILRSIRGYKILVLGNHDCEGDSILPLAVDEIAPYLEIGFEGRSIFVTHHPSSENILNFRQINLHVPHARQPAPDRFGDWKTCEHVRGADKLCPDASG